MSGNGWCTHPDRQVSSDVRILVRKAELACRNAWGSDLWEPANASDVPAAQSETPSDVQLPSTPMPVAYDDEVTSVVSADEHQAARGSLDDEVVEQSTISFVDDDYDPEQDERRDLLYRDSRSAIERARERARQRYAPREEAPVVSDDDDVVLSEGDDASERTAASLESPTFEPDDFIEEEAPTSAPVVDEHDDALISEGIRTPSPRSRRLRRFRDDRTPPKEVIAAKIEPEPDEVELELPPSAAPERGRFDSIPEISADIDLPLLRRPSSATVPDVQADLEPAPESSSYERALKRAHAVNHAARVEQNQQRRREAPPVPLDSSGSTFDMPDLPEAVETRGGMGHQAATPTGTSAILHPRVNAERADTPGPRETQPAERELRSRRRPERTTRPSPEARQSWWRGGRKNGEHQMHDAVQDEEPEPALEAAFDDVFEAADEPFVVASHDDEHEVPSVPSFDLRHDEDLASFRARLFASDQEPHVAPAASSAPRNPISMARRERRPLAAPARTQRAPEPEPELFDDEPVVMQERREPVRQPQRRPRREPPAEPVAERQVEPQMLFREQPEEWYEEEAAPHFDVRDLIEGDSELLDMRIEIAPNVKKVCGTCRNYRPSEQPGRGWCTNTWAFTHRQMVNEGDTACKSAIGFWWLPADEEVWLEEFEVAADATPRVDRLLARLDPERRAVGN